MKLTAFCFINANHLCYVYNLASHSALYKKNIYKILCYFENVKKHFGFNKILGNIKNMQPYDCSPVKFLN